MIRAYSGEYMVSPLPLHLAGKRCSHGCWYCFASNPPRPESSAEEIFSQIGKLSNPKLTSVESALWRDGYDLLFSNTTDPLAASNHGLTAQVVKYCIANGRGLAIQTKGGENAADVVSMPPSFFYVTISSDDPAIAKANEPGAPTPETRLELVRALVAAGHFVVWGLNPYFPGWWRSLKSFAERVSEAGCRHVWIGAPHLSSIQIERLPPAIRKNHAADVSYASARSKRDVMVFHPSVTAFLHSMGFNCFSGAVSSRGNFWAPYFALGKKFFPTLDGFVSHLEDQHDGPVSFSFEYFHKWADVFGTARNSQFKQYFSNIGRALRNAGKSDKAGCIADVHRVFWDIIEVLSPFRQDFFGYCGRLEGETATLEKHGEMEIMVYVKGGFDGILMPLEDTKFLG